MNSATTFGPIRSESLETGRRHGLVSPADGVWDMPDSVRDDGVVDPLKSLSAEQMAAILAAINPFGDPAMPGCRGAES